MLITSNRIDDPVEASFRDRTAKLLARAGRKPGSVPVFPPVAVIPLGRPLPDGSCDQLEIWGRRGPRRRSQPCDWPRDLGPVLLQVGFASPPRHRGGGALLPHLFTRARRLAAPGGLFSVALSFESPRLAVSQHPALRSPDFPRRPPEGDRRDHLSGSSEKRNDSTAEPAP